MGQKIQSGKKANLSRTTNHTHGGDVEGDTVLGPLTVLTAANNLDIGNFELRARTFQSDVATGTAPLIVASSTKVSNLNADLLDGLDTGNNSGNIPVNNGTLNTNLNAQFLNSRPESDFAARGDNESIGGSWTFGGTETFNGPVTLNDNVTVASGKTIDGIDVGAHTHHASSGLRFAGHATGLTYNTVDIASTFSFSLTKPPGSAHFADSFAAIAEIDDETSNSTNFDQDNQVSVSAQTPVNAGASYTFDFDYILKGGNENYEVTFASWLQIRVIDDDGATGAPI